MERTKPSTIDSPSPDLLVLFDEVWVLPARREKTFSSVLRAPLRLVGGGEEGGVVSDAVSLKTYTQTTTSYYEAGREDWKGHGVNSFLTGSTKWREGFSCACSVFFPTSFSKTKRTQKMWKWLTAGKIMLVVQGHLFLLLLKLVKACPISKLHRTNNFFKCALINNNEHAVAWVIIWERGRGERR